MNLKRIAGTLKLAAVSFALSGAVFLWSPVTAASTVYAKECNHEVFVWATLVKPTCSKAGKKVRICQDCETTLETQVIPRTAHVGKWQTSQMATCSKAGTRSYICKNCQAVLKTEATPKKSHSFRWEVTKKATCSEYGIKQQQCKNCSATGETQKIALKNHSCVWKTTKEATCTKAGISSHKCRNCGYVDETREVAKKGHRMVKTKTTPATCRSPKIIEKTCSSCGKVTKEESGSRLKHKYGKWAISSFAISGKTLQITQVRACTGCNSNRQEAKGSTAPFSGNHDVKKYYYKHTPGSGRIVILCAECHQSVTGTISGTTIKFTKPKKDASKPTAKGWKSCSL